MNNCKILRWGTLIASIRHCSQSKSALFVSGKYGTNQSCSIIPDLTKMQSCFPGDELSKNLNARRWPGVEDFDNDTFKKGITYLKWVDDGIERLEVRRGQISHEFSTAEKMGNDSEVEKLRIEAKELKKTMKGLTKDKWKLEDTVVMDYLRLPNRIHPDTPEEDLIVHQHLEDQRLESQEDHNEIDFLSGSNGHLCFLFDRLPHLELNICHMAEEHLIRRGYEAFSGPDFARSTIMEGCEPDPSFKGSFWLKKTSDFGPVGSGQGVHLIGSSSFQSFVGHFSKNVITNPSSSLPLNFFSIGRKYSPSGQRGHNLFNTYQSTAVELFGLCRSSDLSNMQFRMAVDLTRQFYDSMGVHYRVVMRSPRQLDMAQSRKTAFEMYAPSIDSYVEVANVAAYDDYVSNRLMLMCVNEVDDSLEPLHIIGGTFANVTKLIGCLLESASIGDILKWCESY